MGSGDTEAVDVLGVRVDSLTRRDLLRQVASILRSGRRARVMYANVHTLNIAYRDGELRRHLNGADVVYCDGEGVRLAARLLGGYLPQRMTGADWIYDLCAVFQAQGYSLYFLGGEPGVAARAADKLGRQYPGLQVVGTHHGHYDHNGPENDQVIARINTIRPHVLLVGFGTPLQEKWIARNLEKLNVPVVWAMGALLDFVTGKAPRAPRWMLKYGLEWLGRLMAEPRRLWRRYLIGNPLFLWRVLGQRLGLLELDSTVHEPIASPVSSDDPLL